MSEAERERKEDLVKRLRDGCSCNIDTSPCAAEEECRDAYAAADRIEQLAATNEELSNCVAVLKVEIRKMALDYLGLDAIAAEALATANFQMYVDANEARIDAEAKLSESEDLLAKAQGALHQIAGKKDYADDPWGIARTTLAELKGQDYDHTD